MNTQITRIWLTCSLVFSAILLVVLVSFYVTNNTVSRELDIRVKEYADVTEDLIDDQLRSSEDMLWAGAGFLNVNEQEITNDQWSNFIKQSGAISRYPGILGIGYSVVNESAEEGVVEDIYNITIHPETNNDTISPIVYLYTENAGKINILGFDMYSSDVRREAMQLARDNNSVSMTKPIRLVQNVDKVENSTIGFVMYAPHYQRGTSIDTIDQRREQIEGYVYSVFTSQEFLSAALIDQRDDRFSYQIYSDGMLLYEEPGFGEKVQENYSERSIVSDLRGEEYTIRYIYNVDEILPSSIRSQPPSVLAIGLSGAALVTFLTWLLLSNRNNEMLLEKEREINEAKDSLLSIASHQLRTPATGVKQYLGMVIHGMAGDITATQKNFLEKAYESNERQLKIINDVLYLARLESGRITVSKTRIKVRTTLHSLIEEMHESIEENGHKIKTSFPKKSVYIWADEHMVRMILENLLSNAIKYTPERGKIHITLKRVKNGITIAVKDSGVGIKKEQQEEIFKQFSRVSNSLSKSVSGSGIGLYLVKNLVELHNGTISVDSDGENGTTFELYLPTNRPE